MRTLCITISLLLAAVACSIPAGAQQKTVPKHTEKNHYTTLVKTQGATRFANVQGILQDRKGDIWVATAGEGVYRYSGKYFTQYTVHDGLTNNRVWSLIEDNAGNIWMGTDDGLCRFDGKAITPVPIVVMPAGPFAMGPQTAVTSAGNEVWCMMKDRKGILWFGTRAGVFCYDGRWFTRFLDNTSIVNKGGLRLLMVARMLEDRNGTIWFCSGMVPGDEGICWFDGKDLTSYKPGGGGWIRTVVQDRTGTLWLGTRHNGNWCYDGHSFTKYTARTGIGAPRLLDSKGNLWFDGEEHDDGYHGTGGIWCYDGRSFRQHGTSEGLGDYAVWAITEDRSGKLWIGTRGVGLFRYDGRSFTDFTGPPAR